MTNKTIKLSDFPEEVTKDGLKIYGETSYENQMAVLSHYLQNHSSKQTEEQKTEIVNAIRDFLSRKEFRQGIATDDISEEQVWMVAEEAIQYDLFADFFNVPFVIYS